MEQCGVITDITPVWGAGSNYRWETVLALLDRGWQPLIPGPRGRKHTAGADIEMCMSVKLLGWKVYFDENLLFKHYMPAFRTTWQSLRKMKVATGRARLIMDNYKLVDEGRYNEAGEPVISWSQKLAGVLRALVGKPKWAAKSLLERKEGDWYLLYLEEHYYYLVNVLKHRKRYYSTVRYLADLFNDRSLTS